MRFELSRRAPDSWLARIVLDDGSVGVLGTPCADVDSCLRTVEAIVGALRDETRPTRHGEGRRHAFTLRDGRGATIAEVVARADAADADATLAALRRWASSESQFPVTVPGEPRARRRRVAKAVRVSYALDEPSRSRRRGLEALQRASDGLHSAHVNDADGRPLLYLPGFSGRRQRDAQARSLVQALGDAKRYRVPEGEEPRHFVVVGRNGRELARSRVFKSESELAAARSWLLGEAPALARSSSRSSTAARARARPTPYPLHLMSTPGAPGFEIVAATARLLHFRFNDVDGHALLLSHAYRSTKSCEAGVRAVIAAGSVRSHYRAHVTSAPCFFAVLAANGQELARSRDLERAEVEPVIHTTMTALAALVDVSRDTRVVTVKAPSRAAAALALKRAPAIDSPRSSTSAAPRDASAESIAPAVDTPHSEVSAAPRDASAESATPTIEVSAAPRDASTESVAPTIDTPRSEVSAAPRDASAASVAPAIEVSAAPRDTSVESVAPAIDTPRSEVSAAPRDASVEPRSEVSAAPRDASAASVAPAIEVSAAPRDASPESIAPAIDTPRSEVFAAPRDASVERAAPAVEVSAAPRDASAESVAPPVAGSVAALVADARAQQAHDIVRRHVMLAIGLGLVPLPWFDGIRSTDPPACAASVATRRTLEARRF
ncbi:hypothetical protein [Nannocystis punicea]|uniref:Uncharacterized protein n=1 Tax=Nannocystis punicea TaxID=2995304 RepID=A0ABY7HJV5_9BACT|nr:hypothetical protein [Nannocystis poenicansa]WAS99612.1 hypothetical protein O0S08_10810 [Nannocystis poenicansa]